MSRPSEVQESIRVSVAVMHHPSRATGLPELIRRCAPLVARPVPDPDPGGSPSPLRTAKQAWAAIEEGATHHLVLQDDAVPTERFAEALGQALATHPFDGVALYSNWNSPQNSYLVRRAAVAGSPWAPLSRTEWTPTQGFVLPVDQARDLAKFLAEIPDEVRDDDEMVTVFCREQGIKVLAPVPHLLDHADSPTIAGHPGSFHATVFAADRLIPAEHWSAGIAAEPILAERPMATGPLDFVVELVDSECRLRFLRAGTGEPVEHPFGWYWRDWCALVGADPNRVASLAQDRLAELPADPNPASWVEVWAACYLLGADAAIAGQADGWPLGRPTSTHALLVAGSVDSWVSSGLRPADQAELTATSRRRLVELGVAAVTAGGADGLGQPLLSGSTMVRHGSALPTPVARVLDLMVRREARCHLLVAPAIASPSLFVPPMPLVAVRVRECPWCGANESSVRARPEALPLRGSQVIGPDDDSGDMVTLTLLGCESLTARSLLPLLAKSDTSGGSGSPGRGPLNFRTRAVTWVDEGGTPALAESWSGVAELLGLLAAAEGWADGLIQTGRLSAAPETVLTLPASTKALGVPEPCFLGPHANGAVFEGLNDWYLERRQTLVRLGMATASG